MQFKKKIYIFWLLFASVLNFTNSFSVADLELTVKNVQKYPRQKKQFISKAKYYLEQLDANTSLCNECVEDIAQAIKELLFLYPQDVKFLFPLIVQKLPLLPEKVWEELGEIESDCGLKEDFFRAILQCNDDGRIGYYLIHCQELIDFMLNHFDETFVMKNLEKLNTYDLQNLYYKITDSRNRKKLRSWAKKKYGIQDIDLNKIINDDQAFELQKPSFLYRCSRNSAKTQTEKHFCKNIARIVKLMNIYLQKFKHPSVKRMLWQAFIKEASESKQNRYVFFHGRQWLWDFISDMYKRLYNVTSKVSMPDDYVPLRFGDSERQGFSMNYALFGNASDESSSTVAYVLFNCDCSDRAAERYSVDNLFKQFGLYDLYIKYQDQLTHLKQLHQEANLENYGSLLLLSIADEDICRVSPVFRGSMGAKNCSVDIHGKPTQNTKKIIQTLRTKPSYINKGESDRIEFGMLLTRDYALDPYKGLRIFKFNAADQEKYQQYCMACDALFAQIAAEVH